MNATYRTRFAPSPTGALHLGHARTMLVAWLRARAFGGRVVMRIEDLDPPRVVPGAERSILDDLRWLGLGWDEGVEAGGRSEAGPHGPYHQSARGALYDRALAELSRDGAVFRCTCSRRELRGVASAPHAEDRAPRYPGTCRHASVPLSRPASLRFRMDEAPSFDDVLFGAVEGGPPDDFVVRRADGLYAYALAVVVDDAAMGITEVVRGADLLTSTPKQVALFRALRVDPPRYFHVPLVLGEDGERLAKRHASPSLAMLRTAGFDAGRVLAWLGRSLGLDAGDRVAATELVGRFDPTLIPKEAVVVRPLAPFGTEPREGDELR